MNREAADVRLERGERGAARDVGDPRAGLDRTGDLADRPVGDAEKPQLAVLAHGQRLARAVAQRSPSRRGPRR